MPQHKPQLKKIYGIEWELQENEKDEHDMPGREYWTNGQAFLVRYGFNDTKTEDGDGKNIHTDIDNA